MKKPKLAIFLRKEQVVLVLLVLIASACMSMSRSPTMDIPRVWILGLLGAVGEKIAAIESWFTLAEENSTLKRLNAALTLENAQLREAALENSRLRELLGFERDLPYTFIPVRVVGTSYKNFISSVIINAGSNQGLFKDAPLLSPQGLVGKLYVIGANQSLGQLLIDRNFRVSGRVQRSRETGIVRWEGNTLVLDNIPKRSDVRNGDVVITSGLTEMFPRGLTIGTVEKVSETRNELFLKIHLSPSVDFNRVEELFVIDFRSAIDEKR